MDKKLKILFADDHQLILESVRDVIIQHIPEAIVETVANKTALFRKLKSNNHSQDKSKPFDILIQDIKFGEDNAFDFIKDLKNEFPLLKILVLSTLSDPITISRMMKIANGYVLKLESSDEMINGILSLSKNIDFISTKAQKKINAYLDNSTDIVLTRREKEVLKELMNEHSSKGIAEILHISIKTVEMHRSNIFAKLDVKNLTGLVKKVIALNLLE